MRVSFLIYFFSELEMFKEFIHKLKYLHQQQKYELSYIVYPGSILSI